MHPRLSRYHVSNSLPPSFTPHHHNHLLSTTTTMTTTKENTSEQQEQFMDKDMCILLDTKDNIIGQQSKRFCHVSKNIADKKALHRAFSVFLFNENNELLLQQRASTKITFPSMWTNTCCSHPLYNIEPERDGVKGVGLAAQRKLEHELGIPTSQIHPEKFQFMTRILYEAPFDENWGEAEIDYCLMYKCQQSDLTISPEKDEVDAIAWVSKEKLHEMMNDDKLVFTPWFKLIVKKFLDNWWDVMANEGFDALPKLRDDKVHDLLNEDPDA